MSPSQETLDISQASPPEEESDDITLEDIIVAFLDVNPTPSDEQVHHLAALLKMTPASLEEVIYKMFGQQVESEDVEEELESDEGSESMDAIERLLLSFFAYNPEPSDEEIHRLAEYVGLTPAELEERLYAMMAELDDSSVDGVDLLSV